MAKDSRNKQYAEEARRSKTIPLPTQVLQPLGRNAGKRRTGQVMPTKGPSNIIVMTPNPLPAPKDVKSQ